MKKLICGFLLLILTLCCFVACNEEPTVDTATEIKNLMSTYEANIENADFSKFTYSKERSQWKDRDGVYEDLIVSYDESGFLYFKKYKREFTNGNIEQYEYTYQDTWLYIDGTNLIWANKYSKHNKSETRYYDVLECTSLKKAQEEFIETALDILEDLFEDKYNKVVSKIPTDLNLGHFENVTDLCEDSDVSIVINSKTDTKLDFKIEVNNYVFENGLLSSCESESTYISKVNGIDVQFENNFDIKVVLTCDTTKPNLSAFTQSWT